MNNNVKAIAKFIKELREARDITQSDFAKKLGTTQSAVARIENGEQNLSTEMIDKIGNILGKPVMKISDGSMNIKIEGGRKLKGTIETKTSKNGAMGLICASLLNKGKTTLKSVPRIEEVNRMIEVLQSIGVSVKWNENDLKIEVPERLSLSTIDADSAKRTRSIIMLIGSLIHRSKKFSLPQSGGCKLGSRTVKPHFYALENFGVSIKTTSESYEVTSNKLQPAEIVLYESGDTVTENTIIAAALIPGRTVIKFASANYQVQDLCFFLESLGVKIDGIGTTTLTIHGIKEINKDIEYYIGEDPIDTMFFIATAIVTNSKIKITRAPIDFLEIELLKLKKMGLKFSLSQVYKSKNGKINLVDIDILPSKLKALDDKIESRPYPGLNIDNLPFFAIIGAVAEGQTFIHDWVYEKRAIHYKELDKLGADTMLADPHRFYINGPTKLKATEAICPPALRPGALLLIGMLGAAGTSILRNIYSINRGYEDIVKRLNKLGARITIIK